MDYVIDIQHLAKDYGTFRALDDLTLQVPAGEVHGFMGPNGAGKSTTIRVLLGLLRSTSGTVSLLGGDPWDDVVTLHRRLAYVPGDVSLWPSLTGGEAIDLIGKLRGGLDEKRRARLLDRFELDPTKRSRTYSKGNRQKVAIVAALSSDVELLILDEPTSGLDPLMEEIFQQEIAVEKDKGRTILLSSHIMSEVEALADRISIIRQGTIVDTGSLDQMREHTRTTVHATVDEVPPGLENVPGVSDVTTMHGRLSFAVESKHLNDATAFLARARISSLQVSPPSLEDLFLRHYNDDDADSSASA
jgi:ABC-2 type transport system ATP-binding protein